jgi:alpha-glucosidase
MSLSTNNARHLRPNQPFHLPPTAQPIRSVVTITLEGVTDQPLLILTDERRSYSWQVALESAGDNRWSADVVLPMEPTLVRYYFSVGGQQIMERRQREGRNRPIYGEWSEHAFKIAVYDPARMPADWTQGMLMYQIFPDRFASSDPKRPLTHHGVYGQEALFMPWDATPEAPPIGRDFFGGDLRGLIQRLDYLKELGVECIYLNPIFEASTNHRYEAINFMKIDPMLGTEADFDELVREAHARGIKLILDAVFNHCSSDSIYFDITGKYSAQDGIPGAAQSKDSPYFRWFNFRTWPNDYDGWLGFGFMPEFVESPEMEEYFVGGHQSVTAYWLEKGIDGWRCDVAFDNTETFWRRFRKCVNRVKPGAYTVAEDWRDSTHYLLGDEFNAAMNYRFAWAVRGFLATDHLRPSELDDRLMTWLRDTPPPAVKSQMNLLDSHDTDRLMTACSGDVRRFKQAFAFLLAYVGAPCIYYGSETALEGAYAEDGRRTMPWGKLNQDSLGFLKHAINTRNASRALRLGDVETVVIDDSKRVYAFARRHQNEVVYAVFNASDSTALVRVPLLDTRGGVYRDLLGYLGDAEPTEGALNVQMPPRSFAWYRAE